MVFSIPVGGQQVPPGYTGLLDQLDRSADRLDSQFRIPLTNIRFGWDPVVGLIPIAGDIVMAVMAFRLVGHARQLGACRRLIGLMMLNVVIDLLLGAIPLAGPVFDLFFKANLRNLKLLTDEIRKRQRFNEADGLGRARSRS